LFVACFGVGVAVLTTWLAQRVARPWVALGAGLVVALLPSQVVLSSVVLRESLVWFGLTVIAASVVVAAAERTARRVVASYVAAAVGLLFIGWLRDQTMVIAAWILVLTAFFGVRRWRVHRVALAALLVIAVPI